MDLNPIVGRTLGDQAAEQLRDAIRTGTIPRGARLVERELAERLAISRIPIREAIQKLADEGLVLKIPHRGAFVYAPSSEEIEEISSLRIVLEKFVIERALDHWTPQAEQTLEDIIRSMEHLVPKQDVRQIVEQDLRFHYTLWNMAEHNILLDVVSGLRSRISRFLCEAASALPPPQLKIYIDSHRKLLWALKSGDVELAKEAMTYHILSSKERILLAFSKERAENG